MDQVSVAVHGWKFKEPKVYTTSDSGLPDSNIARSKERGRRAHRTPLPTFRFAV